MVESKTPFTRHAKLPIKKRQDVIKVLSSLTARNKPDEYKMPTRFAVAK